MITYNITANHVMKQTLLGIPVCRARIADDLIVVRMNGLFETKKAFGLKHFQSLSCPLGWQAVSRAAIEMLMVDFRSLQL